MALADEMRKIKEEDECNDTYGRIRMYQALKLKSPKNIHIPSERTVYRIMKKWCYVKITDTLNLCFLVKSAKCTNWSHLFHGLLDNESLMA